MRCIAGSPRRATSNQTSQLNVAIPGEAGRRRLPTRTSSVGRREERASGPSRRSSRHAVIICLTECSRAGPVGLRSNSWVTMLVALRHHARGKSTSRCSNETSSRWPIRASCCSHSTAVERLLGVVKKRRVEQPSPVRTSGSSWVWGSGPCRTAPLVFRNFPCSSAAFCQPSGQRMMAGAPDGKPGLRICSRSFNFSRWRSGARSRA